VALGGLGAMLAAHWARRPTSRPALLVSIITAWLGAWVLWGFAGGLAAHYGVLETYDTTAFGLLAAAGAFWQYRTQVRQGRQRALAVFVAGQLVWLGVVLVQNGVLSR
jgi:hypothetical protein